MNICQAPEPTKCGPGEKMLKQLLLSYAGAKPPDCEKNQVTFVNSSSLALKNLNIKGR
jgi:hypothetical protein